MVPIKNLKISSWQIFHKEFCVVISSIKPNINKSGSKLKVFIKPWEYFIWKLYTNSIINVFLNFTFLLFCILIITLEYKYIFHQLLYRWPHISSSLLSVQQKCYFPCVGHNVKEIGKHCIRETNIQRKFDQLQK